MERFEWVDKLYWDFMYDSTEYISVLLERPVTSDIVLKRRMKRKFYWITKHQSYRMFNLTFQKRVLYNLHKKLFCIAFRTHCSEFSNQKHSQITIFKFRMLLGGKDMNHVCHRLICKIVFHIMKSQNYGNSKLWNLNSSVIRDRVNT